MNDPSREAVIIFHSNDAQYAMGLLSHIKNLASTDRLDAVRAYKVNSIMAEAAYIRTVGHVILILSPDLFSEKVWYRSIQDLIQQRKSENKPDVLGILIKEIDTSTIDISAVNVHTFNNQPLSGLSEIQQNKAYIALADEVSKASSKNHGSKSSKGSVRDDSSNYIPYCEETVSPTPSNDCSTDKDLLGFGPYVNSIYMFLTSDQLRPPLTMSVEGEWGSGKSSFMKQIKQKLKAKGKIVIDFNLWRHGHEESVWSAFALVLLSELTRSVSVQARFLAKIRLAWYRLSADDKLFSQLVFASFAGGFLFYLSGLIYFKYLYMVDVLEYLVMFLGVFPPILLVFKQLPKYLSAAKDGISRAVKGLDYEEKIDYIEKFHLDLKRIIQAFSRDRIYIFIDDLDRCQPQKAAELVHALNLMLSDESPLIIILGMDRSKIAAGIASSFSTCIPYLMALDDEANRAKDPAAYGLIFGNSFLEKFIQIAFSVPHPCEADLKKMILALNRDGSGKSSGSEHSSPENDQDPSPDSTIEPTTTHYNEKLSVSIGNEDSEGIISSLLSVVEFLDFNPRRAKQALNLMRLYGIISDQTDMLKQSGVTTMILAKFVTIALRWPTLLNKISQDPGLVERLENISLGSDNSDELLPWSKDQQLMKLIAKGIMVNDNYNASAGLKNADLAPLLKICPKPIKQDEIKGKIDDNENGELNRDEIKSETSMPKRRLKK